MKYALRKMEADDIEMTLKWRNSNFVGEYMFQREICLSHHTDWFFQNVFTSSLNIFEIDDVPIGCAHITRISKFHNRGYWEFYLGKSDAPKGAGSVMAKVLLDFAFKKLKLYKLCAEIMHHNSKSVKIHYNLGFDYEGALKNHILKDGKRYDVILMAHTNERARRLSEAKQ